ncbi:MAG: S1C family serine protease [Luteitalea sp.]
MQGAALPLKVLADAVKATADAAAAGVLQVRARGSRPATAAHVGDDLVIAPQHALDRDDGLVVIRGDDAIDATVVGRDELLDLALLRAPGLGGSPLSSAPQAAGPGQLVVAVARDWQGDLLARLASITGATCPVRRWRAEPLPSLLRTDVMPGRGVSGAVLVDPEGQVQAWLTTGLSRGTVLGIPAAVVADRVARLTAHGRIRRGYVGVAVQPVTLPAAQQAHGPHGLLVSGIDAQGPGAGAGLLVGDVLMAADGHDLPDPAALHARLTESRIGSPVELRVLRGVALHEISVLVGERAR